PEDEALVAGSMPSLRAALPAGAEVELVARDGIARGGVVIRSSEGTVDARIETQFRRMRDGLVGGGGEA
ncbi:MAG: Flagellar assembly protein FliH, partial [Planctomycetota bacterium]